ncbi:hypothetical protein F5B20DRAFT_88133, partial [Whalleya microplaca]
LEDDHFGIARGLDLWCDELVDILYASEDSKIIKGDQVLPHSTQNSKALASNNTTTTPSLGSPSTNLYTESCIRQTTIYQNHQPCVHSSPCWQWLPCSREVRPHPNVHATIKQPATQAHHNLLRRLSPSLSVRRATSPSPGPRESLSLLLPHTLSLPRPGVDLIPVPVAPPVVTLVVLPVATRALTPAAPPVVAPAVTPAVSRAVPTKAARRVASILQARRLPSPRTLARPPPLLPPRPKLPLAALSGQPPLHLAAQPRRPRVALRSPPSPVQRQMRSESRLHRPREPRDLTSRAARHRRPGSRRAPTGPALRSPPASTTTTPTRLPRPRTVPISPPAPVESRPAPPRLTRPKGPQSAISL